MKMQTQRRAFGARAGTNRPPHRGYRAWQDGRTTFPRVERLLALKWTDDQYAAIDALKPAARAALLTELCAARSYDAHSDATPFVTRRWATAMIEYINERDLDDLLQEAA